MKPSTLLSTLAAANAATAYPGMDKMASEIKSRGRNNLAARSTTLIGDLADNSLKLTASGTTIKSILQGKSAATVPFSGFYFAPGSLGSTKCAADTCCVWRYVAADMQNAMAGCNAIARGAVRLGFHDAATWNSASTYGGADGSIVLSDEMSRSENNGLQPIVAQMNTWYAKYHPYGAGMADMIQLGANLATAICPGGPRIRTYVGRVDNDQAGPEDQLPSPFADAETNIALFEAKTFTAADLIALVGAHTVSEQTTVVPSRLNAPQDSTPAVWDTAFYDQTVGSNNNSIMIFPSDKSLATYGETAATWQSFRGLSGVAPWAAAYASAYFRMSMLGVNNMNDLTDCTKVISLF